MKAIVFATLGLLFSWLFYERFWRYRDCIEEALSSCITPEGDNLTSGGIFWGFFAFVFFALAVVAWLRTHSQQ